jgi:putative tryptophan/tyrosine transport system substrate-binding protein
MKRREFIAGLAGAAAWPVVARAQQNERVPVVGFLHPGSLANVPQKFLIAFRQGLAETGYDEGRNVAFEFRWAEGHYDRLPLLGHELVQRKVAVLAAVGNINSALAAKAATTTIPIVFRTGDDPVASGVVASLNRPNGNVTGVTSVSTELSPKRLQLVHEMAPAATSIAVLVNPTSTFKEPWLQEVEDAARALGLRIVVLTASAPTDFEAAFTTLDHQGLGALIVQNDSFFFYEFGQLVSLAAQHKIVAIYHAREAVDAGGLMSYGASISEEYRLTGFYVGRILKGESPADLPVMQPSKFEFVINLQAAKQLGLAVPPALLALADQVIE